jgi:hypothetical protein
MASLPKKVPPANFMVAEYYRRSFYGFKWVKFEADANLPIVVASTL